MRVRDRMGSDFAPDWIEAVEYAAGCLGDLFVCVTRGQFADAFECENPTTCSASKVNVNVPRGPVPVNGKPVISWMGSGGSVSSFGER